MQNTHEDAFATGGECPQITIFYPYWTNLDILHNKTNA